MGRAGIPERPAQVGGRPDFSGLNVAERTVLPADPALPRGHPSGSDTEREKDTLRLEPTDARLSA